MGGSKRRGNLHGHRPMRLHNPLPGWRRVLLAAVIATALLLTLSRAGIFSVVGGLLLVLVFHNMRSRDRALLFGGLATAAIAAMLAPPVRRRILTSFRTDDAGSSSRLEALAGLSRYDVRSLAIRTGLGTTGIPRWRVCLHVESRVECTPVDDLPRRNLRGTCVPCRVDHRVRHGISRTALELIAMGNIWRDLHRLLRCRPQPGSPRGGHSTGDADFLSSAGVPRLYRSRADGRITRDTLIQIAKKGLRL